jgi:aminopeptidase-like protein
MKKLEGERMYSIIKQMFPICRSITGTGFRETLEIIREIHPGIIVHEVPSGTQVFDWTVPKEWNVTDAYIEKAGGEKIVDFKQNNLHLMGYSTPIDEVMTLADLLPHIYTMPDQPTWIPYVTSYYKERWGFCMTENEKNKLKEGQYHVVIKSELKDGHLTYGELVVTGSTDEEILFTSYLCHPSMANNELSGPALLTEIISYVKSLKNRRYTYRFLLNPETIGSITYLSRNLELLRERVKAAFVVSCVGDDRAYSIVHSRYADTLADKVLENVLKYHHPKYNSYSFLNRGSDERQFGSPNVDLPVCGFCRSKYGEYPEYHTSADDMNLISEEGLQGSFDVLRKVVDALEYNYYYKVSCFCEPQLGKRGLYPTVSRKGVYDMVKNQNNFIAYCDGRNDLIDISNFIDCPTDVLIPIIDKLKENDLLVSDAIKFSEGNV